MKPLTWFGKVLIAGAFALLMVCLCTPGAFAGSEDGLVLARDGKALAKIVVPPGASGAAMFAASELRDYLSRVSRATFEVTSTVPGMPPRIFLGDCEQARAKGLYMTALKPDGFYRAVVDGDLYILGRDDPDKRWTRGSWDFLNKEHGTQNGVYDLLEDVCGVRWFMPGKLGEVVPRMTTITVPGGRLKDEPAFIDRSFASADIFHYPSYYPDAADVAGNKAEQLLWLARLRYSTVNLARGCHSTDYLKYGERFGEQHPEWFSLMSGGQRAIKIQRGSYLCWSQPGFVEQFTKDARAYLSGQPPAARGLESWYGAGFGDTFMVDPHDGYEPCTCELCTVTRKKYSAPDFSEVMFSTVARVAEGVKDLDGKYITTLAYPPKRFPPESVTLPDNVRVRLAISGPVSAMRPTAYREQMALLEAWSRTMKGDLVLWIYANVAHYKAHLHGAIETMPHATSRFLKAAKPYIKGLYACNNAMRQTYRLLDCYVLMQLLWDPDQDVDALLSDYFTNCYGPAAEPIQALYARLEALWEKAITFYPESGDACNLWHDSPYGTASIVELWEKVYTKAELDQLDTWLKDAEAKTAEEPRYAARAALLRKHLYGPLVSSRESFIKEYGSREVASLACRSAPVEPAADGFLPPEAWRDAQWRRLDTRRHALNVIGRFKVLWRSGIFYLYADLEEPKMDRTATKPDRAPDDLHLWKDNELEVYFSVPDKFNSLYQLMMNDRGVYADLCHKLGRKDVAWTSKAEVRVSRKADRWTLELALPMGTMGVKEGTDFPALGFNVMRHRVVRDQANEVYTWSPATWGGGWGGDPLKLGEIKFVAAPPQRYAENLVKSGSFEAAGREPQSLADWAATENDLPRIRRDTEMRRDGKASAHFESTERSSTTLYQDLPEPKPDTAYRFRCRVRTENVEAGAGGRYPDLNGIFANLAMPGVNQHVPKPALRGTNDWRKIKFTVRTSEEFAPGAKAYVRLTMNNASGKAWFDDVRVQEVLE